jgi:hypothetical protein
MAFSKVNLTLLKYLGRFGDFTTQRIDYHVLKGNIPVKGPMLRMLTSSLGTESRRSVMR